MAEDAGGKRGVGSEIGMEPEGNRVHSSPDKDRRGQQHSGGLLKNLEKSPDLLNSSQRSITKRGIRKENPGEGGRGGAKK